MSEQTTYDTESSASRQHYIDTGEYLRPGEAEGIDDRICESGRYSPAPCSGPADQDVTYFDSKGTPIDRHPACFTHALAEVDRHYASAGIARVEFKSQEVAR